MASTYNDPYAGAAYQVAVVAKKAAVGEKVVPAGTDATSHLLADFEGEFGIGKGATIHPLFILGAAVVIYFVFFRKRS